MNYEKKGQEDAVMVQDGELHVGKGTANDREYGQNKDVNYFSSRKDYVRTTYGGGTVSSEKGSLQCGGIEPRFRTNITFYGIGSVCASGKDPSVQQKPRFHTID